MKHFASLLRVSKTWNSVVKDIGYHVKPIKVFDDYRQSLSLYPDNVCIDFNPIVDCTHGPYKSIPHAGGWAMHFRLKHGLYSPVLVTSGDQFLTNPPVTQITLSYGGGQAVAMLRVSDGIRLRDVTEAGFKLGETIQNYQSHWHCRKNNFLIARIFCARSGSLKDILAREERLRKEDPHWKLTSDIFD